MAEETPEIEHEPKGYVSDEERHNILGRHLAIELPTGKWRIESQSQHQAVLVKGHRVNHVLHLLLCIPTVGLWAIIWLCLILGGGESRKLVHVDEFGNVSEQGL